MADAMSVEFYLPDVITSDQERLANVCKAERGSHFACKDSG